MEIGKRVRKIRIDNRLSQNEFADKLNVSRSTLMLIEQGNRKINIKILEALKTKYCVSTDWILFGEVTYDEKQELELKTDPFTPIPGTIIFYTNTGPSEPILKLCENGDILVKGKLIENDKEVVDAMREFLELHGAFERPIRTKTKIQSKPLNTVLIVDLSI